MVITDADLDAAGPRIVYANPAYRRLTGLAEADLVGARAQIAEGPPADRATLDRLRAVLARGEPWSGESVGRRRDGTAYEVELRVTPLRDGTGRVTHFVSVQRDLSARRRTERELERLTLTDELTGLANRTLFNHHLERAVSTARRERGVLALVLLDLDRFKEVNDTFGHQVGDVLLREIGPRLRAALRESDTVARLGGDEFGVLLTEVDRGGALRVARRFLAELERPFEVERSAVVVSASVGISLYPEHGEDGVALLRQADIAMYAAKECGDGVAMYAPELDRHSPVRLAMAATLRQAIRDGALALAYQPIVALDDGRTIGVEALARWRPPGGAEIPPSEFVPVAERSGLMRALTEWVIGAALRECGRLEQDGRPISVAVNLSMRNLIDPELPATVKRLAREAGVDVSRLRVEITEGVIMADAERTLTTLLRLRELGVGIAIDDFGTGYSSLAYLHRLPVDTVKIGPSFVAAMCGDPGSAAIVRSTIELAHSLGLAVIAEGVEDAPVQAELRRLGCDAAQGYHLHRPTTAAALPAWLDSGRGRARSARPSLRDLPGRTG